MIVKQIKSFDKNSNEADIIVSDGMFDLLCYCYPSMPYSKGTVIESITTFLAQNIIRAKQKECLVFKLMDYYAYHLQGKIIDLEKRIVCVGKLKVIIDGSIPDDIQQGEFVEFDVQRLDCSID